MSGLSGLSGLVEEAMKRSGVIWLALPGLPRPRAAWHLWRDGSAYVLTGGAGEQPLPGLPGADRVTVIVPSRDKGGRLVSWVAEVTELQPDSEPWRAIVPLLAKERLNAADRAGQAARWARDSYLFRLTPTGEIVDRPNEPAGYATVRPMDSPAKSGR